jgi:hypothetical protein
VEDELDMVIAFNNAEADRLEKAMSESLVERLKNVGATDSRYPKLMKEAADALEAAEAEIKRLRLPPNETLSDHPGCGYCMEAGTPIRPGQVCPRCGDRLPTKREYEAAGRIVGRSHELDEMFEEWWAADGLNAESLKKDARTVWLACAEKLLNREPSNGMIDADYYRKMCADLAAPTAQRKDAERHRWWRDHIHLVEMDDAGVEGVAFSFQLPLYGIDPSVTHDQSKAQLMDDIADAAIAASKKKS